MRRGGKRLLLSFEKTTFEEGPMTENAVKRR